MCVQAAEQTKKVNHMAENNVYDLTTLKKVKLIEKDLAKVVKFYDLAIAGLSGYVKYIPVAETVAKLRNEKAKLVLYHTKCNNIIAVKGKIK